MTTTAMTATELMRRFSALAKEHGWDIESKWRDGDGITESAEYVVYLDSIEGMKEHGR